MELDQPRAWAGAVGGSPGPQWAPRAILGLGRSRRQATPTHYRARPLGRSRAAGSAPTSSTLAPPLHKPPRPLIPDRAAPRPASSRAPPTRSLSSALGPTHDHAHRSPDPAPRLQKPRPSMTLAPPTRSQSSAVASRSPAPLGISPAEPVRSGRGVVTEGRGLERAGPGARRARAQRGPSVCPSVPPRCTVAGGPRWTSPSWPRRRSGGAAARPSSSSRPRRRSAGWISTPTRASPSTCCVRTAAAGTIS